MTPPASTPDQNQLKLPFPAWRLKNGGKNAADALLESASSSCEKTAKGGGFLVVAGLVLEVLIAARHAAPTSFEGQWGNVIANILVTIGVFIEVLFSSKGHKYDSLLTQRSKEALTKSNEARIELEKKLLPRELSQEQFNFIQTLKGTFKAVAIAYEGDVETRYFAGRIRNAFFCAEIPVVEYPRDLGLHSTGIYVYEPKGFDGAVPRTVGPLLKIFEDADAFGPAAVFTEIPSDILEYIERVKPERRAPLDTPILIIGGRFVLTPPHLEKAAKTTAALIKNMNKNKGI